MKRGGTISHVSLALGVKRSPMLSRKNRETKDRVPNRKIATGGGVRCPAPSGAAVTLLIDAFKPGLGAPASLVAALQLWAWKNAQYTVFSEGAARHFCLVGGALRRYISGRGGAPDRRRPHGGRWRSSRRAEVRQHQVAGAHFEGRALVRHTQSVREETEPRRGWKPEPEFLSQTAHNVLHLQSLLSTVQAVQLDHQGAPVFSSIALAGQADSR